MENRFSTGNLRLVTTREAASTNDFYWQIWYNVFVVGSDKVQWWRYFLCYRNQKDMKKWDARHRPMHHIAYAFTDVIYLEVCKWTMRKVLQFFHQSWYSRSKNMWMVSIYIPRVAERRKNWGDNTNTRQTLALRNEEIFRKYQSGSTVSYLAEQYHISAQGIYKILSKFKR